MIDLQPDDIVRIIFGFVLSGQPACLPSLSLTCKRWHRLVAGCARPHGNLQIYANMATQSACS